MTQEYDELSADEGATYQKRRSKAELAQDKEREQIRSVLATPNGRAVLSRIIELTSVKGSGMHIDAHHMAFQCGMREVGIKLMVMLRDADAQLYRVMEAEEDGRRNQ